MNGISSINYTHLAGMSVQYFKRPMANLFDCNLCSAVTPCVCGVCVCVCVIKSSITIRDQKNITKNAIIYAGKKNYKSHKFKAVCVHLSQIAKWERCKCVNLTTSKMCDGMKCNRDFELVGADGREGGLDRVTQ